jgi:hypothetical protein
MGALDLPMAMMRYGYTASQLYLRIASSGPGGGGEVS